MATSSPLNALVVIYMMIFGYLSELFRSVWKEETRRINSNFHLDKPTVLWYTRMVKSEKETDYGMEDLCESILFT